MVELGLLDLGDFDATPALVSAAKEENMLDLKHLIRDGADIDAADWGGATSTMLATRNGNTRMLAFLLKCGADIQKAEWHTGWTALHWAARVGDEDAMTMLIAAGADVHATDKCGRTALSFATQGATGGGGGSPACAELLLGAGATSSMMAPSTPVATTEEGVASESDADDDSGTVTPRHRGKWDSGVVRLPDGTFRACFDSNDPLMDWMASPPWKQVKPGERLQRQVRARRTDTTGPCRIGPSLGPLQWETFLK